MGAILAMASIDAALSGPWLDEFWTLELSDRRNGLAALVRDGWLHDAHPPIFNAWTTVLASLGVTSIAAGRLVSNLLAASLMILAAARLARRMPEQAGFNAVLLLLVLSLPQTMDTFASYRSYFWQIAAIATLIMVARHVSSARIDLDWRKDLDLAAIGAAAGAFSIGLHYVGGLFGGLLAGAIALSAWRRGLRRWACLMLATAALSGLFVLASVALQADNWAEDFDHSWIDLPGLMAFSVPATLVATAICHNPVPLVGLGRRVRDPSELRMLVVASGVLFAGLAIVLAANELKPIVVERYLVAVPVLVCAMLAVPGARLAREPRLFGLLALVSVAAAVVSLVESGLKPRWNENAAAIGRIVAQCPTTRVYAASGWVLGPAADTRTAHREDAVFEGAYRSLARRYGFAVDFIPIDAVAHAAPGPCPVLLWFEHTPNEAEDDLPAAVEAAGLSGLLEARLSAVRTTTGFFVRADRQ